MAKNATIVTDWRKLFSTFEDQSLQFYLPIKANGNLHVFPPIDVIEKGELRWKNAIIV